MENKDHDPSPTIEALGIVQEGSPDRWKATGFLEGLGWLEARGSTMPEAMDALPARVEAIVREKTTEEDA